MISSYAFLKECMAKEMSCDGLTLNEDHVLKSITLWVCGREMQNTLSLSFYYNSYAALENIT